ncbi:MAG: NADPH:quinone oxidoreductase family protein [Halobacteriaceae archaeon]
MRAVQVSECGDPSVLSVVERPVPEPGPGEVRLAVDAAGVNFADVEQRRGRYPDGPETPFVPGLEVAGTVDAVGADLGDADVAVGDRVAALPDTGGYAEQVVVPVERLFPAPDALSDAAAASYPVQWLTAHNTLFEWGELAADETVLVTAAAGGVGSAAVQLASDAGATVLGAASTAEKRSLASDLGATHAIDYTGADLGERVREVTDGRGVDLVLDGVGGDAFRSGVESLAPFGRVVVYGLASGDVPRVATPRLLFENTSVRGYHLMHALDHRPERVRTAVEPVVSGLTEGRYRVAVDAEYDLADAAVGHRRLEGRESTGKLVLRP